MGSIPPAASIEYPQREIVNAIKGAVKQDLSGPAFPPDNADLAQLARAIQSSLLNTARDTGVANAYACNLTPAPTALYEGMEVTLKIAHANTGPSVFNINALGNKPIVNPVDGSALAGGALVAGLYVKLKYDGTNWQIAWSQAGGGIAGAPIFLPLRVRFTLTRRPGNDAWDGTVAVFTTGVTGPFATLQRAASECQKYNLNNYNITINVANGTYAPFVLPKYSGSGYITWQGNSTTPSAVTVQATGDHNAIDGGDFGTQFMNGFKVSANGPSVNQVCGGIFIGGQSHLNLDNIEYGFCQGAQLLVSRSAQCTLGQSTFRISGGSSGNGVSPAAHALVFFGGNLEVNSVFLPTLIIPAAINLGVFVEANSLGVSSYVFATITGAGNVTAQKYRGSANAIINSLGNGVNYYPGAVAGVLTSGAQYT